MMRKNVFIVALVLLVALVSCAEHECVWKEVSVTEPTCASEGERVLKCNGCGATRTEKIAKLPHELADDGWKFNDVDFVYEQKCKSCNEMQYKKIESGVRIQGIAGFENRLFETANEAYAVINEFLKNNGGLGQESLKSTDFDNIFTDIDENGDAKVVWTIYGEQRMIEDSEHPYFLSFGRKAAHYGDGRHFSRVAVVGGNASAKLIRSTLSFSYDWWDGCPNRGDVAFKNISMGAVENSNGQYLVNMSQAYTWGVTMSYENCSIKGFLYCYVNNSYALNVKNCTFDSILGKEYSIHVQGSATASAAISIEGCTFKNSRGVNIDQTTAEARIVGNTFKNCGNLTDNEDNNYYGAIQVTQGANVLVDGNTIENCKGNAIWVWSSKGVGAFTGKLTVKDNLIKDCSYAFADYGNEYTLESSGNKISGTNVDKCFARVMEDGNVVYKEIDAETKLQ